MGERTLQDQKDQRYWSILDTVVRLEVAKGHLKWKISDVARLSGVQRTLIYYYFGKSKENIVKSALRIIGHEFFGLSPERLELWQAGRVEEAVLQTRALAERAPHVKEFFFHWRHQDHELGRELAQLEKRYLAKLKSFFKGESEAGLRAIYTVIFGLIIVPELPKACLARVLESLPGPRN